MSQIKLMIAVPTAGFIRHAPFIDYYNQIEKPDGTLCTFSHGASPAKGRNLMIEAALQNNCTHILFIDDDMAPKPDVLKRLISHDKDVVTALYLMRGYPHLPLVFDEVFSDGKNKHMFLVEGLNGLVEVTNCGFGCVLIKTEVFKSMEQPWVTLGELEKDGWCDDISFFNRVREAEFKIYCDLDAHVGHMTQMIVSPNYVDGKWFSTYNTGSLDAIQIPQFVPMVIDITNNPTD